MVSEPAGIWWHSLAQGASKGASVGSPAPICNMWAAAEHRACLHRAVCPQQCHCQQDLARALGALRGCTPHKHCMGCGELLGAVWPQSLDVDDLCGFLPVHRVLHGFDSRAVPTWLLVAWSSLAAPTPAPMPQAECGGRRGVFWGQSWVQAGHPGAWGRAGMGREAPGLGRAGSRTGDDVWADVSDRTR